ncbi:MAG: hypothetical protein ABR95_13645 [Sphingobacteriales bacterium BACL12 MAG-120813-bin55]|jgi:hypothetical protein|nr:MAG: hypothetical protein ABR95_13645 [Sphingobacteriales bacterium BACL12 MAG-120813-bin55]
MIRFFLMVLVLAATLASCSRHQAVYYNGALHDGQTTAMLMELPTKPLEMTSQLPLLPDAKPAPRSGYRKYPSATTDELMYTGIVFQPDTAVADSDTLTIEPKLQPLVVAGAGITAGAVVSGVLLLLSAAGMLYIPIALLLLGVGLTTLGYKKIKLDPEVWKGEKLALLVYYSLVPIGLFLMLYPVWVLFNI